MRIVDGPMRLEVGEQGVWIVEVSGGAVRSNVGDPDEPPYEVTGQLLDRDLLAASFAIPAAVDYIGGSRFRVTWRPEGDDDVDFQVDVTDGLGKTVGRELRIVVEPKQPFGLSISGSPPGLMPGEDETIKIVIAGGVGPFQVVAFDDRDDFVVGQTSDNRSVSLPVVFDIAGTHVVTVEVADASNPAESATATVTIEVDLDTPEGAHWLLVQILPNGADVDQRWDAPEGTAALGSFTTCTTTSGSIMVRSFNLRGTAVTGDVTFTWTFDPPPAALAVGTEFLIGLTGTAEGEVTTVPNPRSQFQFRAAFDAPNFFNLNIFGDLLVLEGFPNVSDGPATVTGSPALIFSAGSVGQQVVIRAAASGHIAGACSVDYLYEFVP